MSSNDHTQTPGMVIEIGYTVDIDEIDNTSIADDTKQTAARVLGTETMCQMAAYANTIQQYPQYRKVSAVYTLIMGFHCGFRTQPHIGQNCVNSQQEKSDICTYGVTNTSIFVVNCVIVLKHNNNTKMLME